MDLKDLVKAGASLAVDMLMRSGLVEQWPGGRACAAIRHRRPREWVRDPKTGLMVPNTAPIRLRSGKVVDPYDAVDPHLDGDDGEVVWNVITNVGRIQLHKAGYDTTGLPTNGFNYVALSNDTLTETASSTTLSTEIAANGLSRAQGTVTLPTGSGNQTTVAKTFTATGAQSAQKAALFDASSAGDMNHALAFTQRSLITDDTLAVTFTITLG